MSNSYFLFCKHISKFSVYRDLIKIKFKKIQMDSKNRIKQVSSDFHQKIH